MNLEGGALREFVQGTLSIIYLPPAESYIWIHWEKYVLGQFLIPLRVAEGILGPMAMHAGAQVKAVSFSIKEASSHAHRADSQMHVPV